MKKLLSLILIATFILTLSACKKDKEKVLVVGYDPFSEKFSPFFAATGYDMDVVDMTSVSLMTTDRDGGIIYDAIEGETVARGENEYYYSGIANLDVEFNSYANQTTYTIEIRDDVKFSDGHVMDADDVIFSYYVLLDPYYSGSTTLSSVDIAGFKNYKYNSTAADAADLLAQDFVAAIYTEDADLEADYTDEFGELIDYVKAEIKALLAEEYDWVVNDVLTNDAYRDAGYWKLENGDPWVEDGTASAEATFAAFYNIVEEGYSVVGKEKDTVINEIAEQYGLDYKKLDSNYGASMIAPGVATKALDIAFVITENEQGEGLPVAKISGITKVSDTVVQVLVNGFDAAAIYQVAGITVAPLHYYGNEAEFDYAANKFGFANRTVDSMATMEAKTAKPLGAGPYKFVEFKDNVVRFEANKYYYKGAPKIKYINFQVTTEENKVSGITTGDIDISNPSGSRTKFAEIADINKEKGNIIFTSSIDNLGYGYIGINAKNVAVGSNPEDIYSDESKALRTAFATVLSALRYTAINSYYGEAASIINYPMSNTSWASPKQGEDGYEYAFSKNPDGTPVYGDNIDPATLTDSERNEKAKAAAKLWLIEAGYNFDGDTVAPTGAKLTYEIIIPGGGSGDHPSFDIVTEFKNIMSTLGITIDIDDPDDSNELWDALDALEQEMWCAAWGSTIDPDMYQVYHGNNVIGGADNSTGSNHYYIRDETLNAKIMEARSIADQTARKALYKDALNIIMEWAVEVPIYQRQNIVTISVERVDLDTLTPEITTYWGWIKEIEKLEMK